MLGFSLLTDRRFILLVVHSVSSDQEVVGYSYSCPLFLYCFVSIFPLHDESAGKKRSV